MKISIWRQFSSNNSSSYVIVGAFEAPEKAYEAAEKFKAMLRRIWEWYVAHPDAREIVNTKSREITDAEREIMRDYRLEFDEALDWVAREDSLDFLPDAVAVFENLVFVATTDETETDDMPLAEYMHQLGADVKFEEAMESYLTVRVSATAPDDITAQFIKNSAEAHFMRDTHIVFQRPPWAHFYDGQLASDLEQLTRDMDALSAEDTASHTVPPEVHAQVIDRVERRQAATEAQDYETANALTEQIREILHQQAVHKSGLSEEDYQRIRKIMCKVDIRADHLDKSVTIVGSTIKFPILYFMAEDLGHGLPALVTWMRALGCTDVTYEFVLMPYSG